MKGNVLRLIEKGTERWNSYTKDRFVIRWSTLYTIVARGGPLNTEIIANSFGSLLKIITPFLYFLTRFPYPAFPSLLPRFGVPSTTHFACFSEHLTPANPPMFFSHILTDGITSIVSERAPPVINKIPYTSFAIFLPLFSVTLTPLFTCFTPCLATRDLPISF